jgi:anti-sigma factor RsiW
MKRNPFMEWVMEQNVDEQRNVNADHENVYILMMDALDGEIEANHQVELETHLHTCPTCMEEWQALLIIDTLFRQTPAVMPAADFAQRTMARLPNRARRVWTIAAIYLATLLAGTLPALIGFWAVTTWGPVLTQPTLIRIVLGSLDKMLQVAGTVTSALLSGAGQFVLQQPTVIGWLLVMAGIVALWSGVYQQVLSPQTQRSTI